jgi:hypothetical protein
MNGKMAAYVKRYLDISDEEIFEKSELLLDTLFYRKQVAVQQSPGRKNEDSSGYQSPGTYTLF